MSLFDLLRRSSVMARSFDRSAAPNLGNGSDDLPRRRVNLGADVRTIYAIGDVHGCFEALLAAEAQILSDISQNAAEAPAIIYLGDFVDRGPSSMAVISHLVQEAHPDGVQRIALCGNHDEWFLRFIRNPFDNLAWLEFGGDATLQSYAIPNIPNVHRRDMRGMPQALSEAIPTEHIEFLENLPVLVEYGNYLFVHAGIKPGIDIENQRDEDMLWIREPFLTEGPGLPLTVVHGHTVGLEPVFSADRICIDTGCYATGRLTVLKVTATGASLL